MNRRQKKKKRGWVLECEALTKSRQVVIDACKRSMAFRDEQHARDEITIMRLMKILVHLLMIIGGDVQILTKDIDDTDYRRCVIEMPETESGPAVLLHLLEAPEEIRKK